MSSVIQLRGIQKNYYMAGQAIPVLKGIDLDINRNEYVALMGPSGSGKSTLIKLLYRLYDVDSGSIVIDNQDIRSVIQESLRSEMSIVPQECMLFDDLQDNINLADSL